ncbi:MAG: hypothetical protein J5872_06050 [Lachnospiraceae bacterium]|nr:hypothetical protein [Lachnospiraceae bacterium]
MSFPRRKLDMDLLILERESCERMTAVQKKKNPAWDFDRFEAFHYGSLDEPADPCYDTCTVLADAAEELDRLDAERPFLLPLERGTHYVWELFSELPKVGSSKSTRQFWNRLSRAMSDLPLPMGEDELIDAFTKASLPLLEKATDLGDRFYLSELDYGGWSGGIVSKDFLVDGLQMLVKKLKGPLCERSGVRSKKSEEPEEHPSGEPSGESPENNQKEDIKEYVSEQEDRTDL